MSCCFTSEYRPKNRQAGIAVVSAMLLAALVVSIAAAMIFEQQRFINRLENHFSATQARWMGEASIHWSRAILAEDAKGGAVDHLKENWAIRLPATPFEGGTIRGFITDQQQYCNLNNLMQAGSDSGNAYFFKRLLSSIGSNPDAVDALKDWIDPDGDITYPYGAESEHYLAQPIPYRTANQPLTEIGNLSRVQGFTDESIAKLRHYCSVLPEPTTVNVNTASPELLGLMLPDLSQFELQTLIAARDLHPFENISEVGKLLEKSKINLSDSQFSVGSRYFMVTSQTQFGKSTIRVEALLKRDGGVWPQLLWKRYR
jgi:general secretion pathway protein K